MKDRHCKQREIVFRPQKAWYCALVMGFSVEVIMKSRQRPDC